MLILLLIITSYYGFIRINESFNNFIIIIIIIIINIAVVVVIITFGF